MVSSKWSLQNGTFIMVPSKWSLQNGPFKMVPSKWYPQNNTFNMVPSNGTFKMISSKWSLHFEGTILKGPFWRDHFEGTILKVTFWRLYFLMAPDIILTCAHVISTLSVRLWISANFAHTGFPRNGSNFTILKPEKLKPEEIQIWWSSTIKEDIPIFPLLLTYFKKCGNKCNNLNYPLGVYYVVLKSWGWSNTIKANMVLTGGQWVYQLFSLKSCQMQACHNPCPTTLSPVCHLPLQTIPSHQVRFWYCFANLESSFLG